MDLNRSARSLISLLMRLRVGLVDLARSVGRARVARPLSRSAHSSACLPDRYGCRGFSDEGPKSVLTPASFDSRSCFSTAALAAGALRFSPVACSVADAIAVHDPQDLRHRSSLRIASPSRRRSGGVLGPNGGQDDHDRDPIRVPRALLLRECRGRPRDGARLSQRLGIVCSRRHLPVSHGQLIIRCTALLPAPPRRRRGPSHSSVSPRRRHPGEVCRAFKRRLECRARPRR